MDLRLLWRRDLNSLAGWVALNLHLARLEADSNWGAGLFVDSLFQ